MRGHAVDGNALEPDRLTRAPTVAGGPQRSRLSAERRGALGEKIGGELRGDRVLGIAPGIDAQGAQEGGEGRDRLGPRAGSGLRVGFDFAMSADLVFE